MKSPPLYLPALLLAAAMVCMQVAYADSGVIQLCDDINWPLFTSDAEGDTSKGTSFDLVHSIFSRIGVKHRLSPAPWRRCLNQLKEGSTDIAPLLSINSNRLTYLTFSKPILYDLGEVYYRKELAQLKHWNSLKDFSGLRIGLEGGYNYSDLFSEPEGTYQLNVTVVTTNEQGLEMVAKDRLDAFLTIRSAGQTILESADYKDEIGIADKPYSKYTYHMGISNQSPAAMALLPKLNQAIDEIKQSGELQKILKQHLSPVWGDRYDNIIYIEGFPSAEKENNQSSASE